MFHKMFHAICFTLVRFSDKCSCLLKTFPYIRYTFLETEGEADWKQRHYNLTMSLRNQSYKNDATLKTFLWELKKSVKEIC